MAKKKTWKDLLREMAVEVKETKDSTPKKESKVFSTVKSGSEKKDGLFTGGKRLSEAVSKREREADARLAAEEKEKIGRVKEAEPTKPFQVTAEERFYGTTYEYIGNNTWKNNRGETYIEEDDEDEKEWYEEILQLPGALEDGLDWYDIPAIIIGTGGDVILGAGKGGAKMVEGVGKFAGNRVADVADLFGADDWADQYRSNIADSGSLVDEWTAPANEFLDDYSVLGNTGSEAAETIGQIGTIWATGGLGTAAGLGTAGTTALTSGLTFGSSMGHSEAEAYLATADADTARLYGAISGGIDAGTELLFGGLGKGTNALGISKGAIPLDDLAAKKFASAFKNKWAKNAVEWGVKSSFEGFEEVIAGYAQAHAQHKTFRTKDDLDKILEDQQLAKAFFLGALGSGIAQAPGAISSTKAGRDFVSGYTDAEQSVIDKEVENRIAEKEKDGKKLNNKEKGKIFEAVEEAMKEGEISIDTIEEVLGGDSFKAYKDALDSDYATLQEYADQYEGEDLKKDVDEFWKTAKSTELKNKLSEEVFGKVKDGYLSESYFERERRKEKFTVDLNEIEEKQRATYQRAIDSGVLNNTRRTRKFVDILSRMEADKGVLFNFANNQRIKETGFSVEGKQVNGYIDENGNVVINVESPKAWQTTVGHEITHVLENTDLYQTLQDTLFEYAKSKKASSADWASEFDERMAAIKELYSGVKGYDGVNGFQKMKKELAADLVGDYLFTDENFVRHLSTKNRNVFQKMYDEVKYLLKVTTAGSKEAKQLEKVKKVFDDAWKAEVKGKQSVDATDSDGDVRFSLVEDNKTIDFLENQEHLTVYKAMVQIDGKLYPPMASQNYVDEEYTTKSGEKKTRRVRKLKNPSVLGQWQQAEERPDLVTSFVNPSTKYPDGYGQFDLLKSNGKTTGGVAYNPYEHTSNIVLNDQFAEAYQRPELVTVEYHIPVSELTSGYKAQHAKDKVGLTDWKAGGVAQKLKNSHRDVYLTRWSKPVRVLSDAEVAQKYKEILDKEEGISVPWNVVTPSLRVELEKIGVPIDYSDIKAGSTIRNFEAAMRGDYDKKAKKSKQATYSLSDSEIQTIQSIGQKSVNAFNSQDIAATEKFAQIYWEEMGTKSPFYRAWFGDWRANDQTTVQTATQRGDTRGTQKNEDTGWNIQVSGKVFNETKAHTDSYNIAARRYLPYINDIVRKAVLLDSFGINTNKPKSNNSLLMHSMYTVADIGNGPEILKLYVEEMNNPNDDNTSKRAYQLQNIEKYQSAGKSSQKTASSISPATGTVRTVADLFALVKQKDGNFVPNDSSKIVNSDGTPKVMYHGSPRQFTSFDRSKAKSSGQYGSGFYFTDSASHAGTYGNQYSVYLNIRNPLQSGSESVSRDQVRSFLEEVANNEDYSIENYGTYDIDKILDNVMGKATSADAFKVIQDINLTAIGNMVEAAELFNDVNGTSFDGIVVPTETVAFYPEQIKSATDNIGIFDKSNPDIRYSLSDSDGKQLSQKQADYFKDSKVRDADGNLLKVYHTTNNDFTVFDKARKGEATGDANTYLGFFFADDAEYMSQFPEFENGKTEAYYLNIKNPIDMNNISREAFLDIVEATGGDVTEAAEVYDREFEAEQQRVKNNGYNSTIMEMDRLLEELTGEYFDYAEFYKALKPNYEQLMSKGYDGIINSLDGRGFANEYIVLDSNQAKLATNQNPTDNPDIHLSLSNVGEKQKTYGNFATPANELMYQDLPMREDAAPQENLPIREDVQEVAQADVADELFPDDLTSPQEELDNLYQQRDAIEDRMIEIARNEDYEALEQINAEYDAIQSRIVELEADESDRLNSLDDADAPPMTENVQDSTEDVVPLTKKLVDDIARDVRQRLGLKNPQMAEVRNMIERYSQSEMPGREELFYELKAKFGKFKESFNDESVAEAKSFLRTYGLNVSDSIKQEIPDYANVMRKLRGRIRFANDGTPVDMLYHELSSLYPHLFPESIYVPTDQFERMVDVAYMDSVTETEQSFDDESIWETADAIIHGVNEYKQNQRLKAANKYGRESFNGLMQDADRFVPPIDLDKVINRRTTSTAETAPPDTFDVTPRKGVEEGQQALFEDNTPKPITRKGLHEQKIADIDVAMHEFGGLDEVLKNAKNLSTFSTVDNTPQRVMEKALGYKQGQILSDLTVNKVAESTTEGIKWLNSVTDRKNGLLAQLSKQYHIKPGSKESSAAQMYAEGFYVDANNDIVQYGDAELAKDFPNIDIQKRIRGLARDPRIRKFYDDTLALINESRARNAYPEIQKLDNYFLHFRAMDDTFSKLGLPFNPNDIRAKDLPTDLNGVTADLKPGQPYFASAKHREGKRTSFDLLGGLERYATSAMPQIYYIDHIQTLRALRNHIADTYGQANGLEGLDLLSEEEAQERIEQVYGSHLSTFAKFLNEEANVLAGKTALIDRGLEGIIGRRGMTFLDTVNKQVGSNMVGLNASSSLTNFLAGVQAIAKTSKVASLKALAQTASSKVQSIFGKTDSFVENNPTIIRRKGADRFYRTPFQKVGDAGYVLMSAVDNVTTEFIVRAKYNEYIGNGMSEQQAITEADKWASRLMGDRSLGQQPQLYNSKMLGLVTKFQLEVRNQLDSQFYDTIQEANASTEDIKNGLARNAKKAAKVTSTFFQLAVLQNVFGKAFESVAGYNPAFDIISVLATALGFDDDEESEDTALDNIEQGFLELLGDLPYTSTFTGGRIPISSALPIKEFVTGKDQYGNEKSRWETISEAAPYYFLPTGYGQIKKTQQGLKMFDDDLPIAGSYTDSGALRFPVEDTPLNRIQAGLFGQWASENAREYFDNERKPLKEKQIQEFIDSNLPISDYWEYREGLSGLEKLSEKADYIDSLDLPIDTKNLFINNIANRKEDIDMEDYGEYESFEEFDFAEKDPDKYEFLQDKGLSYEEYLADKEEYDYEYKNPEKYQFLKRNGITAKEYNDFDEETKDAYSWAYKNPEKYKLSNAVTNDLVAYRQYASDLYDIRADKDSNGKSISGSAKRKKIEYINSLDIDYGAKLILFKDCYPADDTYNQEIIDYLNSRDDIPYYRTKTILEELGFKVDSEGNITWD